MHRVLLDTDVFSEILKRKHLEIVRQARAYKAAMGRFTISAVTVVECVKGWQKQANEAKILGLESMLPHVEVLDLDQQAALWAGRIYGSLERRGATVGRADAMIAGIAVASGLPVVTRNVAHFDRIASLDLGLRVETWDVIAS